MLAVFLTLALLDNVPAWLAAIVIARDALIVTGLAVAIVYRAPIAIQPLLLGKICTALQVLYIGLHLASLAFEFPLGNVIPADAYVVAAISWISGMAYISLWVKAMGATRARDATRA
jgi:cardiolipin synthase